MNGFSKNQRHRLLLATAVFFIGVFTSVVVLAAPGGIPGPPGDNGGGGATTPDLGDLFVLLRDADGVPTLTEDNCQQPLAAPGVTLPASGDYPGCIPDTEEDSCTIPVDPETCAVVSGYETYTQEVEFGRDNVVRSPDSVFATQLEDAEVKLSTADCVTLDPAGRLVTSTVENDVVTTTDIDSPLQNLAIYKQLMLTGYLGVQSAPIDLPADTLDMAARAAGAASDKAGKVTKDMLIYINDILGLTDENVSTYLPKKCIEVKEEVMGVVKMVRKCFLDYGPTGGNYTYDRTGNFTGLPYPAYIPGDAPVEGWFEYLAILDQNVPTFTINQGPILDAVPELSGDPSLTASNIAGFAVAADDTRGTIDFMHTWPVPGDFATPVPCLASGDINYDVSISDISGLQVPVKMVAGTEGREFTLTVANAGPDAATGTVLLTATDSDGNAIPTFPRTFTFDLVPGTNQSWTEQFSVDYATTVTWTATATAEFDVNPGNNSVTETTVVRGGGGGNGGGGA